jgi:hypothetical protein
MQNNNTQKIDYSTDTQFVIRELEAVHPIFLLDEVPSSYEKFKTEYIEFTSKPITLTEFRLATQKFFAILGDGHLSRGLLTGNSLYIDIEWAANNNKLYLLDNEKKPTNIEVVSIGGTPASNLTAQVDIYYAAENEAARQSNYTIFCRLEDMLILAGCNYSDSGIELKTSENQTITCKFISSHINKIRLGAKPEYIIKDEMINDVFYIDLRSFQKDPSIDETVEKIKNAMQNGINKFIIDIRDNSGGNSGVGERLIEAMGMKTPSYGVYVRHSELSCKVHGYESNDKSETFEPDKNTAVRNENITLLVLTNVNTFSSATMLGVWVQDGKLGKIVGQTSSNNPNHYGDMLTVQLPISEISFMLSFKRFLRPDTEANPDSLIPDIKVPLGEDILAVALDYMTSIK